MYENVVESVEGKVDADMDYVIGRLLDAEEARSLKESVNVATVQRRQCTVCSKPGHLAESCWTMKTCSRCKVLGHIARFCKNRNTPTEASNYMRPSANVVKKSGDHQMDNRSRLPLMADSGATSHMFADRNGMQNYETDGYGEVQVADKKHSVQISGRGKRTVQFDVGGCTKPQDIDVLHVPALSDKNLLSVSKAVQGGRSMTFTESGCVLRDRSGNALALGRMKNNLYEMDVVPPTDEVVCVSSENARRVRSKGGLTLWHQRLGHRNLEDLERLHRNSLVVNMEVDDDDQSRDAFCEGCALGKSKRRPFPKHTRPKDVKFMEMWYSDVCGPFQEASVNGEIYIVNFIEHQSRKVFTYLLKKKSDVFEKFRILITLLENQTDKKMKILRTDGGGEFNSSVFKSFFESSGVRHQLTVPGCSTQNGVAERMNLTLLNAARSMLQHSGLPSSFWGFAVLYASEVVNVCCHPTDRRTTPAEMFANGLCTIRCRRKEARYVDVSCVWL